MALFDDIQDFRAPFDGMPGSIGDLGSNVNPLLSAQQQAASGGLSFYDSFDRADATTLGSAWTAVLSGSIVVGVTGNAATWKSGTGTAVELYGTVLSTDYHKVGTNISIVGSNFTDEKSGVIARASSDGQNYVFARVCPVLGLEIGQVVSGTETVWTLWNGGGGYAFPKTGSLELVVGTATDDYQVVVTYAGNIITYTNSSHTSQMGASYRYTGLVMATTSGHSTSPLDWWRAADAPPTVTATGSGLSIYRASTTSGGGANGGAGITASNIMDTVEYKTADIGYVSSTGIITLPQGWWGLTCSYSLSSPTGDIEISLTKKTAVTTIYSYRKLGLYRAGPSGSTPQITGSITFYVPNTATTYNLASSGTGTMNCVGDADGSLTWMTVSRLGMPTS